MVAMEPSGLEQAREYSTSGDPAASAAPGAALGPDFGPIDARLVEVIDAWPALPEAVRADILAKVREAHPDTPAVGTERP
jgi:hypothetical protein